MGSQRVGHDWRLSLSIQSKCALDFHSLCFTLFPYSLITQAYILALLFFSWWVFKISLNIQVPLLSLSFRYNLPVKESELFGAWSFPLAGKPHGHAGHHGPPFPVFLASRSWISSLNPFRCHPFARLCWWCVLPSGGTSGLAVAVCLMLAALDTWWSDTLIHWSYKMVTF